MGKNKGKKKQPPPQRKEKIFEAVAYIQLKKETLSRPKILKQNFNCARYTSTAIEPPFNHKHRLLIYVHVPEMITAAKRYKNKKDSRHIKSEIVLAKVVVMKKDPGGYYINIFPAPSGSSPTATLQEATIFNPLSSGFALYGEPHWWLFGYKDNDEVSYITINDLSDPKKSLICEENRDNKQVV